jgi:hypothetical protein
MARQYDRTKEATWRHHITSRRASGQTVRAYCERHGLSEPNFYRWQRVLAERPGPSAVGHRTPPLFAAVEIPSGSGDPRLVVVLAGGRRIGVAPGFDPATLEQVVAVLEGRPC